MDSGLGKLEAGSHWFSFRAFRVEKPGFQIKRSVCGLRPQVQGEFQFEGHGLNEAGCTDFFTDSVGQVYFQMRPLFKRAHLDVHAHAPAVFVGFDSQGENLGLFGRHAFQVVFREEKFHERDYTLYPHPPLFFYKKMGEGAPQGREGAGLFIKQERRFNIMPHAFVLDAFHHPVLQVGFFIFNGLAT